MKGFGKKPLEESTILPKQIQKAPLDPKQSNKEFHQIPSKEKKEIQPFEIQYKNFQEELKKKPPDSPLKENTNSKSCIPRVTFSIA